jgi:hypothetical protein
MLRPNPVGVLDILISLDHSDLPMNVGLFGALGGMR